MLFPGVRIPLHVFELRYRTMVRDALSGGRTLAIATLEPGWERDYQGSPAFHLIACLASFDQVEWLPNDCYDLVITGTGRVRFGRVFREFPYRACEVESLPVTPYEEDDPLVWMERHALLAETQRLLDLGKQAWCAPPATGWARARGPGTRPRAGTTDAAAGGYPHRGRLTPVLRAAPALRYRQF